MKYIIIGDNHWGVKSFSEKNFNILMDYYTKEIIPYMIDNKIETIIHMGDLFDNRVKMDINFLNIFINQFINLLKENNIKFITIIGNHDIYFKNRNDVSLVKHLPAFYDGIQVIDKPTELISDNEKMLFIPWLDDIEYKNYPDFNYIFGHFEMSGIFENLKGEISPSSFQGENIKKVFSGHYHNKSSKGKIQYVGTPYQMSWGDCSDQKGIWELCTKTNKVKFIENTISPKFIKIKYYESDIKPYCIQGYKDEDEYFETVEEVCDRLNEFKNPHVKIFINDASTNNYVNDLYKIKSFGIEYELFDNVELKNVTGVDIVEQMEKDKLTDVEYNIESDTLQFIYDNIKDDKLSSLLKKIEMVEK